MNVNAWLFCDFSVKSSVLAQDFCRKTQVMFSLTHFFPQISKMFVIFFVTSHIINVSLYLTMDIVIAMKCHKIILVKYKFLIFSCFADSICPFLLTWPASTRLSNCTVAILASMLCCQVHEILFYRLRDYPINLTPSSQLCMPAM